MHRRDNEWPKRAERGPAQRAIEERLERGGAVREDAWGRVRLFEVLGDEERVGDVRACGGVVQRRERVGRGAVGCV